MTFPMGFNNFLREYFTFNRRERNGVFILLSIILVLILYLSLSDHFFTKEKTDFSKFEREISEFEAGQKRVSDSMADSMKDFSFSGNMLVENQDRNSGYRKKEYPKYDKSKRESVLVEINSADTTELKKIKGIGTVFAKRIVKFRDALGGFIKTEQLLEVYGFDKEKLDQIASQITVDDSQVKKLNINIASVNDLNRHPYINKKEAVAIFTGRVKKGDYTDPQEIKKVALMNDTVFVKIAPYLTTE